MTQTSPEAGFRELYEHAYDDVLRFVQRRAHPSHAEDVTAEVFLVAWRRYAELPLDLDSRRAWLFGVTYRVLANARRGEDRRAALAVRIADAYDGIEPGLHPDEVGLRLDLARAWRQLPATHQEALALTIWEDLSSTQAAQVLGISATAYRLRLSRARRALRTHLRPDTALATTTADQHQPEGGTR
ncbi:RNA polymerase sigma factor [Ornithinimicrobium sp. Y1847]|uniref:RNA polymerase sigma factor n=1 Tax=unclassified Ornithinimicrobium TaxID=2615080 RepID=UPI003B67B833